MKLPARHFGILLAWLVVALGGSLLAGCASSSAQNRKVYDRYAELVAAKSRSAQSPAEEAVVPAPAPKAPAKKADPVDRQPIKTVPAAKAAPVSAPAPAAQPAPTKPAPVQVVAPPPAASPTVPAKPAPAAPVQPAPAPAVPAPPPAPVQPAPAVEPAPAVPAAPVPAVASSAEGAYTLKVGDGLQIYLRGIPTPEVIEDIIDEGGKVTLPFINEIQADGLAASDLERNIRQTYLDQDIYRNITVNVVVPTRYYFVQGEIRAPGRFQIMSATRVSQAIAGAGGYTEFASGRVDIKRGGSIVKVIKNARRLERVPEDDILLEPDDIVEVKRSLW